MAIDDGQTVAILVALFPVDANILWSQVENALRMQVAGGAHRNQAPRVVFHVIDYWIRRLRTRFRPDCADGLNWGRL